MPRALRDDEEGDDLVGFIDELLSAGREVSTAGIHAFDGLAQSLFKIAARILLKTAGSNLVGGEVELRRRVRVGGRLSPARKEVF